ncbi:ketoacyl-synt-domain-containing protein [Mytilinidion resinicola]|uniref:Ketoacyl-synt-domain-containing protein n=1 Tax=Mytilinidion resinicola TaxID=574789 RepID=A0A6A6YFD7_9PEZI|nr:ketoacyl-synt-domain-containing protein [Mytilinidion resinicola]KAF2807319.1 ketoacyl-synt-domain-containing protein [Mytilinidion resinicola]
MANSDLVEPLAIIGLSFRFPQNVTTSEKFWGLMDEKKCTAGKVPEDRFSVDAFYHPSNERTDTLNAQEGHFMNGDVGAFDAPFFSISPAEAAAMDPQQRGMLETSYHALENAGLPLKSVAGSKTGVYIGCFSDDHRILTLKDPERLSKYAGTGTEMSILANRLSWWFDFKGPSFNIDNACASGLTAFHLACQSLRNGETSMALVGGSNLMTSIEQFLLLSNLSMVSPSGRSFSFDHRANGYARGEGYGVVIIKTLSDALHNGDCIRAVVRATGANQDGKTPSLTSPSQTSQEALIRETYERAGLNMKATTFVEAHGTGTAMGDPIEARALGSVLGAGRKADDPLYIGAVKPNIGHLEGASGIAGIIKTILTLERGVILPNTNFEKLNPAIDAKALNITFPRESTPWPHDGLRRASINSFGFGGSNSHTVLDDACNFLKSRALKGHHQSIDLDGRSESLGPISFQTFTSRFSDATPPKLLTWSAFDDNALSRLIQAFSQYFATGPPEVLSASYLDDLAHTLSARRTVLSVRSFAIVKSPAKLRDLASATSRPVRGRRVPGLSYVFTGQGAQFSRMGIDLCIFPTFRLSLEKSNLCFRALGSEWDLLEELAKLEPDSNIHDPEYSQPICTALQIALVDLLRNFGIVPQKVVGHSSGEIAAAYSIGALSLASALRISFFRGRVSGNLARTPSIRGGMLAVGLSEAEATIYLHEFQKEYSSQEAVVACINSPKSVTLAGDAIAISTLQKQLDQDGVFARKLHVNVAYHSPHVKLFSQEYRKSLNNLEAGDSYRETDAVMVSSVTGRPVEPSELIKAEYWISNMESPVRFMEAVSQSVFSPHVCDGLSGQRITSDVSDLLEIGPHAVLQGPVKDTLTALNQAKAIRYDSVLNKRVDSVESLLNVMGRLHCLGYPVDLIAINGLSDKQKDETKMLTDLPSYPFDHSKAYWYESLLGRNFRLRKEVRLDLLGLPIADGGPPELGRRWRKITRVSETPWVQDHVISETTIYPAAGMLCMALEAIQQMADPARKITAYTIRDAEFLAALRLSPENEGTESHFYVRPLKDASYSEDLTAEFKLYTLLEDVWVENCRGTIQLSYGEDDFGSEPSLTVRNNIATCTQRIDRSNIYSELFAIGMQYGPAFQCMENISVGQSKDALAVVRAFEWVEERQDHIIHPVTLDCIFHPTLVALAKAMEGKPRTAVPTKLQNLRLSGRGICHPVTSKVQVYAKVETQTSRTATASLHGADFQGNALISVELLEVTFVDDGSQDELGTNLQHMCYNIDWKADIDMLDQFTVAEYCRSRLALSHHREPDNRVRSALESLMELMAFKRPGLRVLEIGAGEGSTTKDVLKSTVIRTAEGHEIPALSLYHSTDIEPGLLKATKNRFKDESIKMEFSVLDINENLTDQGVQEGMYDVVISNNFQLSTTRIANIRKLLKNDGKLVIIGVAEVDMCSRLLCRNGFSETGIFLRDDQHAAKQSSSIVIFTAAENIKPETIWPDTIIVVNEETSIDAQIATTLREALQHSGFPIVGTIPLRKISTIDLHDKFCICLAELSKPLLADLNESMYLELRSWLSNARGILWVRDNGNDNPGFHMITGVARVSRSENPDVKFVTLAVDISSSTTVSNVLRIFRKTITSSVDDIELEYKEIDGFLAMNRAIPATYVDDNIRRNGDPMEICSTAQTTIRALPAYSFPEHSTYVLAGGFGGIGPTICRWMANRGAKNFIVLSRSGPNSDAAKLLLQDLSAQDVRVEHPTCDISCKEQVKAALALCAAKLPPIKGCIQASLVLQDSVFETMTYDEWKTAINPRIQGTINLHEDLPNNMDFFLLLSSINGILGARFQANYAASNTFLDAFAHTHYKQRVVSIDMGWYTNTLASNDFLKRRFEGLGCVYQVPDSQLLGLLDYYCDPTRVVDIGKCQTMLGVAPPSYARARGKEFPELLKRPIWRVMNALGTSFNTPSQTETLQQKALPISTLLASTQSVAEAADLICNAVLGRLAVQLGIQEEMIDKENPFHVTGVDSLMAVELRTWFRREIGVNVSVFDIMGNSSLFGLCVRAAEKMECKRY